METNRTILRGQIYYVDKDAKSAPVGSEMWPNRPGLVISNDVNNRFSSTVEVVYLSTKLEKRVYPTNVPIYCNGKNSIAICGQVHTVDKSRLRDLMDTASEEEMESVDAALHLSVGLSSRSNGSINLFHKWENFINKYKLDIVAENSTETVEELQEKLAMLSEECQCYKALYEMGQKRLALSEAQCSRYRETINNYHLVRQMDAPDASARTA